MTRPYRPSSGTEGDCFMSAFCFECQRDADQDAPCEIIGRTMAYEVDEPEYPSEWIEDDDSGPRCTAFIPLGDPLPTRCELTVDMFASAPAAAAGRS